MRSRASVLPALVWATACAALLLGACDDDAGSASRGDGGPGDAGLGAGTGARGGIGAPSGGAGGNSGTGGSAVPGAGGVGGIAASCASGTAQCSDGMDNDADGRIDQADGECVSPCDNDEGSFATGISGDNIDACKQDCFFDGDSGQGNDGCEWNLKCDAKNPGAASCPYDPSFKNCPSAQSEKCLKNCRRVTPNGCDCFGCCAFPTPNATVTVMLVNTCTQDKLGDPAACPPCTQQTACVNTCEPCEVCIGKPTLDPGCAMPPGGAGGSGGASPPPAPVCEEGIVSCGPGGQVADGACPASTYCITGCCVFPLL
ncbi:MAG: hypothetical protein KA712_11185 [Myxococcales bacterium]|nr:hypothetical protein [Myxococcales bacterium]